MSRGHFIETLQTPTLKTAETSDRVVQQNAHAAPSLCVSSVQRLSGNESGTSRYHNAVNVMCENLHMHCSVRS